VTLRDTIKNLGKIATNPQVLLNGMYCMFVMGATSVFADLWGIDFLLRVRDIPITTGATACSLVFIGVAVLSPLWGIIASISKSSKIPLVCSALAAVLTTILLLYFDIGTTGIFIICFMFGGFQAVHILNFAILKDIVDIKYLASAIAFVNMFTVAGGAIMQPIAGILIDTSNKINNTPVYSATDYMFGLAIIPVILTAAFIISIFLREKKK
jgi:hypothetical protein